MEYKYYNNNPLKKNTGDCVIRALSLATGKPWDDVYMELASYGYRMADMPSSNAVWSQYLIDSGYKREIIPDTCPDCYRIRDFADDNPYGTYVVATGNHVATLIDGKVYDSWDSTNEIPIYYFWRQ